MRVLYGKRPGGKWEEKDLDVISLELRWTKVYYHKEPGFIAKSWRLTDRGDKWWWRRLVGERRIRAEAMAFFDSKLGRKLGTWGAPLGGSWRGLGDRRGWRQSLPALQWRQCHAGMGERGKRISRFHTSPWSSDARSRQREGGAVVGAWSNGGGAARVGSAIGSARVWCCWLHRCRWSQAWNWTLRRPYPRSQRDVTP